MFCYLHDRQSRLLLWGNPSPACRHLLHTLPPPAGRPLRVWADLAYGGFNFLAQLREQATF